MRTIHINPPEAEVRRYYAVDKANRVQGYLSYDKKTDDRLNEIKRECRGRGWDLIPVSEYKK